MKRSIDIVSPAGKVPSWTYTPDTENFVKGAILFFMDAMGPRLAMDEMAQKLSNAGYFVLLPDLFYRFGEYGPFSGASFGDPVSRDQLVKMINETTTEMTAEDTAAFIAALEREGHSGPFGVVGYCMAGRRALTVAARYPERFAAVASFHGAALASDGPDSPHLIAGDIKARIYVGTAAEDNSFPPEQSTLFVDTFRRAGADFALETYVGMHHGWTVPDRDGVYDEGGAERHWRRLLQLFDETLR
jgi:carboxymethylenebutenolidase